MNLLKIVCAAVLYSDGVMLVGPRHLDNVMLEQYKRAYTNKIAPEESNAIYGFLDNNGLFLNRYEALIIAQEAKQIVEKTNPQDKLFSEDLY
jgi:hypothetical protein